MKIKLLTLILILLFIRLANAQTSGTVPTATPAPTAAPNASAQISELTEADRAAQQVITLYRQGNYKEALPLAQRALEIRSRILPAGDQRVIAALINLAELYVVLKKFKEAEPLYEKILTSYEGAQKPDPVKIGEALDRLALISFGRGDFSKTESLYKRALAFAEQSFAPDDERVSHALYALAEFYRYRFEFKKAEPLYERAIMLEDNATTPKRADMRRALDGFTCLLYESEQADKLKALYEERKARATLRTDSKLAAGGVLNGKAISLPKPVYPEDAKRARISGIVVVKVTIDETGKVIKAEDHCGATRSLAKAAIEAAYRARFTPTSLSGQPIRVTGTITYRFVR